jgi:hypothetical protein
MVPIVSLILSVVEIFISSVVNCEYIATETL